MSSTDAPAGDVQDNSYVNRPGQNEYNVPVVKDDTAAAAATEEGGYTDESTADSDAQLGIFISLSPSPSFFLFHTHTHNLTNSPTLFLLLLFFSFPSISHSLTHTPLPPTAKDDLDIDKTNILESRTRGAAKDQGSYTEPGDEEGMPGADEDGTSRGRQQ